MLVLVVLMMVLICVANGSGDCSNADGVDVS